MRLCCVKLYMHLADTASKLCSIFCRYIFCYGNRCTFALSKNELNFRQFSLHILWSSVISYGTVRLSPFFIDLFISYMLSLRPMSYLKLFLGSLKLSINLCLLQNFCCWPITVIEFIKERRIFLETLN